MQIHIVKRGETLFSIGGLYGVAPNFIARDNGLSEPYRLAVGQALLILRPEEVYTVREGDTLFSVAKQFSVPIKTLWRNNPALGGGTEIYPGQSIILRQESENGPPLIVSGYAYPFVNEAVLRKILPYASELVPFSYGFSPDGNLVFPGDERMRELAAFYGIKTLLHLSTLTENGSFSNDRARQVLTDPTLSAALIAASVLQMKGGGFSGIDVDFEFLGRELALPYAEFLGRLRLAANLAGGTVIAALAPKTSANQPGVLYEGHDYRLIGENTDGVLLMTYEWGYTYGPPMAVAPIESVRRVLDFAVTEVPPEKIRMGFPNYGYDWALPYEAGTTKATSIGCEQAVQIAVREGAEIFFDENSQTPYFHYQKDGVTHEVWFEDARSVLAKSALIREYDFSGIGYWNFMRPFTANFCLINDLFQIESEISPS